MISKLLGATFPGREALLSQLEQCKVSEEYENGSIALICDAGPRAEVTTRVPVEATVNDVDGVPIQILLHVVNGRMVELEIVRMDGNEIRRYPEPSELEPVVNA